MAYMEWREIIQVYWRYFAIVITPIVFLPMLLVGTSEAACGYVILVMATYYIGDIIHLAPVSLIPIFAFPLLGILDTDDLCAVYMNEANMVFLAALIAGVALELSGIHKRIALLLLLKIGTSPRMLLLGVMFSTMIISSTVMDVASAALMIPIVDAIMRHLESVDESPKDEEEEGEEEGGLDGNGGMDDYVTDGEGGGGGLGSLDPDGPHLHPPPPAFTLEITEKGVVECISLKGIAPPKLELSDDMSNGYQLENGVQPIAYIGADDPRYGLQQRKVSIAMDNRHRPSTVTLIQDIEEPKKKTTRFEKCLILSVAYAAAIGGVGTLTGTTTNLVFKQIVTQIYGNYPNVSYATWMIFGVPTMVACALVLCGILQFMALGFKVKKESPEKKKAIRDLLLKHYEELGSMSYHEYIVVVCIFLLLLLWFFRDPEFIPGWGNLLSAQSQADVSDAVPAYFVIILMCCIPVVFPPRKDNDKHLVDWEVVEKKISWDILLLQGGGFAMAAAAESSGLNSWMGKQFSVLFVCPTWLICWLMIIACAFTSEIFSNSSLAAMLLPVVSNLSQQLKVHPIYLMLAVTVGCTLAFTLPISSGPNAIAYKTKKLTMKDMLKTGIISNILTSTVTFLSVSSLGTLIFHLEEYPSWAVNKTMNTAGL